MPRCVRPDFFFAFSLSLKPPPLSFTVTAATTHDYFPLSIGVCQKMVAKRNAGKRNRARHATGVDEGIVLRPRNLHFATYLKKRPPPPPARRRTPLDCVQRNDDLPTSPFHTPTPVQPRFDRNDDTRGFGSLGLPPDFRRPTGRYLRVPVDGQGLGGEGDGAGARSPGYARSPGPKPAGVSCCGWCRFRWCRCCRCVGRVSCTATIPLSPLALPSL